MSSSTSTSASLSPAHLVNLLLILRRANTHYGNIADELRASLRPTHYARKRAQRLGLAVDIEKAVNCPQRQISHIPLPAIDTTCTPSPTALSVPLASKTRSREISPAPALCVRPISPPTIIIPACSPSPIRSSRATVHYMSGDRKNTKSPSKTGRKRRNARVGPTSRFSITPTDVCLPAKKLQLTEADISAREQERDRAEQEWVLSDVPVGMANFSWEPEYPSESAPVSAQRSDSSSSDSSGPTTPADMSPIMIRIKRKSVEVELQRSEKRLKYVRKPSAHRVAAEDIFRFSPSRP